MGGLLARRSSRAARRPVSAAILYAALACSTPALAADLPVRFGAHPTFDRMVFDWNDAVDYRVDLKDSSAVISFDRAAQIDQQSLAAGLARLSSRADVETDGQKLVLRLSIPEGAQLRHFRSGTKVVLDFARGAQAAAAPRPEPAAKPAAIAAPTAPPAAAASPPPPATRKPIALRGRQDAAEARIELPKQEVSAALVPQQVAAAAAAQPPAAPAQTTVPVDFVRTPDGHGLRFGWTDPVGAAVFGRGAHLWIVFDRRVALNLDLARAKGEETTGPIEVIEPAAQGQATILRMSPPGGTASAARREGEAWVIEVGRLPRAPDVPIAVVARGSDPATARLVAEMSGARSILHLRDPDIGDEIVVAPTAAAGAGVEHERIYPQFRLLSTAQGVAIQKLADKLTVRAAGNGVEVSHAGGLHVSDIRDANARLPRAFRAPALFDLAAWRRSGPSRFNEDRQALHRAVADASNEKRNIARLDLARFLFAYGHMEDALGLLRLIEQEEPNLVATAQLRAIRGVASLMSGDLEEARRNLGHQSLDSQPDASLWRGALAMAEGDPRTARAQMGRSVDMYRNYPAPFANRLNLWHAESRMLTDDLAGAEAHLDSVVAGQPSASERALAVYLRGRLFIAAGDREGALAIWEELERTPPTPGRTMAMLDRIDMLIEDRKMTPAEAIPILDRLRFSWRGDGLEFRILARLGRFHIATHDYRAGLATFRNALAHYPKHRDVAPVAAEMAEAFLALFSDKDAKVSPVAAIALYQEFRDLIPKGPRGDQITQGLADRLIAVDLLDRAAEVLEPLVQTRLTGAEKARGGAKLALVRLLDQKPEAAIAALKASEVENAPQDLTRERHRLEARALADLGRVRDAMQRLASDDSREADLLRAELSWRAQTWPDAANALTRLLGAPAAGDMTDEQARQAIRLAVALALSGDKGGLKRFDEQFGAAMRKGAYKDIYQVIASDPGTPVGDVREIAARTAAAAPFQSFLADYRKRLLASAPKS
jgi:tetratricopeptide (TPR) repeat protein